MQVKHVLTLHDHVHWLTNYNQSDEDPEIDWLYFDYLMSIERILL